MKYARRFLIIALMIAAIIGLASAGYVLWTSWSTDVIYLAVVGPMSGEYQVDGKNMVTAVQLYLDRMKKHGELPGKRIELLVRDDQADPNVAAQVAEQLAQDNQALLVIGHLFSGTSIAAGEVYRKYEIPAIAATATAEDVTRNNEWYFRVIPNNLYQGMFVANYIKHALQFNTTSVIALDNAYGQSLEQSFQSMANQIGLKVRQKFMLNENGYSDDEIARVVNEIAANPPQAIFLALYGFKDDVKLIAALRDAGIRSALVGSESFADARAFRQQFADFPLEQKTPGYYTDGMYSVAMFMQELVGKEGFDFLEEYGAKYPLKTLTWNSPCYYDATHVAVEAIKLANLKGSRYIRHDRKRVREALTNLYHAPDHAVTGVTGDMYFDASRDFNRPLAMGVYALDRLLPAGIQYQPLKNFDLISDRIAAALQGDILMINNQFLTRTQVVRTGIRVHQVTQIDPDNLRYAMDFSVWLRFPEGLDAAKIIFPNALTPIPITTPVFAETVDHVTTEIYRLHGEFTNGVDFRRYPVDSHVLSVTFRHATRMLDQVIYVPDHSEPPQFFEEPSTTHLLPTGWKLNEITPYQSIVQQTMELTAQPASEFHLDLHITRNDLTLVISQIAPFILGVCVLIVFMVSLPEDRIVWRVLLGGFLCIVNVIAQFTIVPGLRVGGLLHLEYAIFGGYLFSICWMFWAASAYYFFQKRLTIIRRMPLFSSLSRADQIDLSNKIRRRRYQKPGHTFFRQGDPGESLFIVVEGEIALFFTDEQGRMTEVNRVRDGQFFGELALLTGKTRAISAVTSTPVRVGEITRKHLLPLIKKQPEMVDVMANEMARLDILRATQNDPEHAQQLDHAALARGFVEKITEQFSLD